MVHCWYILELFFLVPTFFFPVHPLFYFEVVIFFRGLIILVDAHLVLILPFHSSAGLVLSQGHPKFPQGCVFLISLTDLYFRTKYHE